MDEKEIIEMLVDAINQGTKKYNYKEAPFLHDAMNKYFEWSTGITVNDIIDGFEEETEIVPSKADIFDDYFE